MYQPLTEAQKEVVKAVLFGKQKQASVINDGVVAVVGRGIAEATTGEDALASEENFVKAVTSFLDTCISEGRPVNTIILLLLGGEQSLLALQSEGPKSIIAESAGPETPKFYFGISKIGEVFDAPAADLSAGVTSVSTADTQSSVSEPGFIPDDLSYSAQRDFLIKKIVPLVPEAVKAELSSPVEQALVGAQWYFKNT